MKPMTADHAEADELQPVGWAAHPVQEPHVRPELHDRGFLVHRIRVATPTAGHAR